jgi:hypothetical protein
MRIAQEDNRWYVISDTGSVLGVFATQQAAQTYSDQYSATKQYSSTVNRDGVETAMDRFQANFKKASNN